MPSIRDLQSIAMPRDLPLIEDPIEYASDLRKRKGGIRSERKQDRAKIDKHKNAIISGVYNDDDINVLIHRNPGAAAELEQARKIGEQFKVFREGRKPTMEFGPLESGFVPSTEARQVAPGIQPGNINQLAQSLLGMGRPDLAKAIASFGGEGGTPFAKINPKDFTPESVSKFQQTGDYSSLRVAPDPSGTGDRNFNRAAKLRGEYTKLAGDFRKVRDSFSRIQASATEPSAAGDLALIFNYMKMLDPGSVVRESEFATAENSAGVPDRIRKTYNRLLEGERLAENTRADFLNRATKLYDRQQLQHNRRKRTYTGLARRAGVSPRDVVIDIEQEVPIQAPGTGPSLSGDKRKRLDELRKKQGG